MCYDINASGLCYGSKRVIMLKAKVIMIASGKGGTGKSTISVLLGGCLAEKKKKVLLVELDSGLRSVDIISGVYGKTIYDIQDVLCGRCEGSKAVVESPLYPGLSVISAPYEGGMVQPEVLQRLIHAMLPYFDYILLDTAAGMGEPFRSAAAVSDAALLVITPDPVTLRDGGIVCQKLRDFGLSEIRLIINRLNISLFRKGPIRDLDECIDTVGAQLIAVLPESIALQKATAASELLPKGELFMQTAHNLARRIMGEQVPLAIR